MPKYRQPGVGSAIGGGIGAGLSGLGEMLMKQIDDRKQNELIMQRQKAEQDNAALIAAKQRAIANPFNAAKEGFQGLGPDASDVQAPIQKDITTADTMDKIPTMDDIINQARSGNKQAYEDSGYIGAAEPGSKQLPISEIAQLVRQAKARSDQFQANKLTEPTSYASVDPKTGQKGTTTTTMAQRMTAGFQPNEATPQQDASAAGLKAGAESAARFPWEQKLAQTKADMSLLNQKSIDDYKKANPAATTQELNRQAGAVHALSMSKVIREQAQELEKQGLMGPIAGRWAELASGKIKSEDLFPDPAQAQLAAEFISDTKLLQSLAANVHAGARGAGSVGILKHFEGIISPVGDLSIFEGQLNGVDRMMNIYAQTPTAPELDLQSMGLPPMPPTLPAKAGPASYLDKLNQLRGGPPQGPQ